MKILLLLAFTWLSSCATQVMTSEGVKVISQGEYERIIEANTREDQLYKGIYNTLRVSGVVLNSEVSHAQVEQSARLYLWNLEKFNAETKKKDEDLTKQAEFFISFYTPERKHDNLNRNKTLWKMFLDVDGKRFEGTATKIKLLTNEVQGIYPNHTRFSTPYILVFPVSMKAIEGKPMKVTITGTVDQVVLNF